MAPGGGKSSTPEARKETWRDWMIFLLFGLAFLTPASFAAWVMNDTGMPIGFTVLMVGLSLPSLLIPVLPKKRRIAVLKGGWPARVAFGIPGLIMGILMLQFTILDLGRTSWMNSFALMLFGSMMAFLGALLLFPNMTDTHSTED